MSANRSQSAERSYKNQEHNQVRMAHAAEHAAAIAPLGSSPASASHGIRVSSNTNYHTAFMQCRSCCNCNSQCCYYGKGHFDALGNYVGP